MDLDDLKPQKCGLCVAISNCLDWTSLRFRLLQEQQHHAEVSTHAAFPRST